jgi:hypothetical protein
MLFVGAAFVAAAVEDCDEHPPSCGEGVVCGSGHGPVYSGGGGQPGPTPPPTMWETNGGAYSYEPGCNVANWNDEIDPVTTLLFAGTGVFSEQVAESWIVGALEAIGLTTGPHELFHYPGGSYDPNTLQHFVNHGACVEGEIGQADRLGAKWCIDEGPCAETRWHVRCNVVSIPSAVGYWASCTPHWDAEEGYVYDGCGHYVQEDFDGRDEDNHIPGSGFDAGRDWLWWHLVQVSGWDFIGYSYFDNIHQQQQCVADQQPTADGKVNLIVLE